MSLPKKNFILYYLLEGMARYAAQLQVPAEGFCKSVLYAVLQVLGHFWCSILILLTCGSNLKMLSKIYVHFSKTILNLKIKKKIYIYILNCS